MKKSELALAMDVFRERKQDLDFTISRDLDTVNQLTIKLNINDSSTFFEAARAAACSLFGTATSAAILKLIIGTGSASSIAAALAAVGAFFGGGMLAGILVVGTAGTVAGFSAHAVWRFYTDKKNKALFDELKESLCAMVSFIGDKVQHRHDLESFLQADPQTLTIFNVQAALKSAARSFRAEAQAEIISGRIGSFKGREKIEQLIASGTLSGFSPAGARTDIMNSLMLTYKLTAEEFLVFEKKYHNWITCPNAYKELAIALAKDWLEKRDRLLEESKDKPDVVNLD